MTAANTQADVDLDALMPMTPGGVAAPCATVGRSNLQQVEQTREDQPACSTEVVLDLCMPTPPKGDPENVPAAAYRPMAEPDKRGGGRGKYKRTAALKQRKSWKELAKDHMSNIGTLLTGNHCSRNCKGCDVGSFATPRLAQWCAAQTYGDAVLCMDWDNLIAKQTAIASAFDRAKASSVCSSSGKVITIDYKVDGHPVCLGVWTKFFGLAEKTGETIDRCVRRGESVWNDNLRKQEALAKRKVNGTLQNAASAWWTIHLSYYEMVVEKGVIQHPRDINFNVIYAEQFVPEMRLLGYPWKLPHQDDGERGAPEAQSSRAPLESECGSRSTWYAGRKCALQRLADTQFGPGHNAFKFVGRAKHSAYKEGACCQPLRLAVAEAIKQRMTAQVIRARKLAYTEHLQWMFTQRHAMEEMIQLSANEGYLVENSDKCGDHCLYLPASYRPSSDNIDKYQFRLALQANVYAGKFFHLSLLLPNLVTGANFGITSMLNGLIRMIQLGEVTHSTRHFMRGMDGGSENVSLAGLAMNSVLVHYRRFDIVQQSRLPPAHSHHYLTDGMFAVIEGWLSGDGFGGVATLPELVTYLKGRFSNAKSYGHKRVEINILLTNFAIVKWFSGHINADKIKRIGDPLVWRHKWNPESQRVIVQYKYGLGKARC